MIAAVAIICATVFACFVVRAVMVERQQRFTTGLALSDVAAKTSGALALAQSSAEKSDAVYKAQEALRAHLERVENQIGLRR